MISFFEMLNLIEAPTWGNMFSDDEDESPAIPPPSAPIPQAPPTTPMPALRKRVVLRQNDPNANLSGKKNLRYELDPHSTAMVKTGRYSHGADRQDVNDTDAYLNSVDRQIRKAERGNDAGYANLHSVLTGANDPTGRIKPDFLASKILKHLEQNPAVLEKGRPYSSGELYQVLRPILANYQPAEIVPSLNRLASFGSNSPFKRVDSAGPDGTRQHGYIFNRSEGILDDDPDDLKFQHPRYRNLARQGGEGRVGTPSPSPEAPTPATPKSAVESLLDSFTKVSKKLDQAENGEIAVPDTQKLTIFNQLKDLRAYAYDMFTKLSDVEDVNPEKVQQFKQLIALMDKELSRYNPAFWVRRESVEPQWNYFPV